MRIPLLATLLLAALAPLAAYAQTNAAANAGAEAPLPAYDVVTIKPNKSGSGSVSVHTNRDNYAATNVSLRNLIEQAYGIREDLVSGIPGPIDSARFDVAAKIVDPGPDALTKLTDRQRWAMLLPILVERFQLKAHTETRILPVYELVVLPSGPKFKPSPDQNSHSAGTSIHNREMTAHGIPMSAFANVIGRQIDRTTIDKTSLSGNYDLTLKWSPDDGSATAPDAPPGIFTALQEQLGLKLQPAKGPVDTLVVDHVEMPGEN